MKFEGDKPKFKESSEEGLKPEIEFIEPFSVDHPEYLSTLEKFEEKDAEINFRPWSLEMLQDVKLSAAEIDVLGPLLTDKPFLQAVEQKYS